MPSHPQSHEHRHDDHAPSPDARKPPAGHMHPGGAATTVHEHAGAHDRHAGHSVEMFRDRFWITLALTIPTLVWSDMIANCHQSL